MSLYAPSADGTLDLPPPYTLVTLREGSDAFAHACTIAGEQGAGTLVWTRRYDLAEFAVVLEPEQPLAEVYCTIYAGMNALADALAVQAPPSRPITFDWPDTIRIDGVLVGGGRLGWPQAAQADAPPDWLVFCGMVRTTVTATGEPGLRPLAGALDELGFPSPDAGEIVASFSRHLMVALDEWNDAGFAPIGQRWLNRFDPPGTQRARLDRNGDLLVPRATGKESGERQSLSAVLAKPAWLDPETGMPWL
jgi:hypothetical protein